MDGLGIPYYVPTYLQLPPTNGLRVTVSQLALPGYLETSSDLVNWTQVRELDGSGTEDAVYYETNAIAIPQKFYRVRQCPNFAGTVQPVE